MSRIFHGDFHPVSGYLRLLFLIFLLPTVFRCTSRNVSRGIYFAGSNSAGQFFRSPLAQWARKTTRKNPGKRERARFQPRDVFIKIAIVRVPALPPPIFSFVELVDRRFLSRARINAGDWTNGEKKGKQIQPPRPRLLHAPGPPGKMGWL